MTDTKKRLEEFNELINKLWDKYGESYEVYNPKEFTREIESFLAESIHQARAEEKSRVRKLINLYGTPNCDYLHHNKKQQHENEEICPVVTEITDLLSSLDKPVTKKD